QTQNNGSYLTNNSAFHYVTSDWHENFVNYLSTPSYTASPVAFDCPVNTVSNQYRTLDILTAIENLQNNLTANYGWLFRFDTYGLDLRRHVYCSSDHATIAYRPTIDFTVGSYNPVAPDYCDQVFAKLERAIRGVKYKPYKGYLYFFYDEEYNTPDTGLNYKVYQDNNPVTAVM